MLKKLRRPLLVLIVVAMVAVMMPAPQQTAEAAQGTTCTQTHVVQAGENLFRIGLRYGVSWTTLQVWNYLPNANVIRTGMLLCVNGYASGAPTNPNPTPPSPVVVYPGNPFGPTYEPRVYFPQATLGQSFELFGYNFPANRQVTIGITTLGNRPYMPYYTATTNAAGEFYVQVPIPAHLTSAGTIAVQATTYGGYYALNWFYNR